MTDLPRYLIYPVDKHQSSPWFLDELRATDIADNDESLDVIVDLWTGQRMFLGQWAPIDGWRKSDVSARLQQLEQENVRLLRALKEREISHPQPAAAADGGVLIDSAGDDGK